MNVQKTSARPESKDKRNEKTNKTKQQQQKQLFRLSTPAKLIPPADTVHPFALVNNQTLKVTHSLTAKDGEDITKEREVREGEAMEPIKRVIVSLME